MKSKTQGFTLLELLIVMAIIGLLSAIILIGYQGQTDKARLAKTMQWAVSVNHLLGVNAVGAWTFDRITGTTVYDDSSNKNDGTIYGGATVVDGIVGKALSFDGVNDYVSIPSNSFNNSAGTMAMWVKPNFDGASSFSSQILFFNSGTMKNFQIWYTNGFLYWIEGWTYCTLSTSWKAGQWHHIAATWNYPFDSVNQKGVKIYVDSKECGFMQNNSTYSFGASGDIGENFNGAIDDVRIYSEALPKAQIEQFYADGLKTHHPLAQQ